MQTWADVQADVSVREAIYLYSGLSYMMQPTAKLMVDGYDMPKYITGFQNGLIYEMPRSFKNTTFYPATIDYVNDPPDTACADSVFEVKNPSPNPGWDTRCTVWYQDGMITKSDATVGLSRPYISFYEEMLSVAFYHYFNL